MAVFTLTGYVKNSALNGIYNATVEVWNSSETTLVTSAKTASNGAYSIPNLAAGYYVVKPAYSNWTFTPLSKFLDGTTPGTTKTLPDFIGAPPGYTISGYIRNGTSGMSGVTVTLSGAGSGSTSTSWDGYYSFANCPNGTYYVTPSQMNWSFTPSQRSVSVSNGSMSGQDFTGQQNPTYYTISGYVRSSGGGMNGVSVSLSGASNKSTNSGASGYYSFSGLSDGTYYVTPSYTNWTFSPTQRTVPVSGSSVPNQDFDGQQNPTYSISGYVQNAAGAGMAGVTVALSGAASNSTTTGSSGYFNFGGLLAGSYRVTPTYSNWSFTPSFRDTLISSSAVTLDPFSGQQVGGFRIAGTVRNATTSTPMYGVAVNLTGGAARNTTTAEDGSYVFASLANGAYTVAASYNPGWSFTPPSRSVSLNGSDTSGQDFSGGFSGATLSGLVKNSAGVGMYNVGVALSGPSSRTTNTTQSGQYTFAGVAEGTYTVTPAFSCWSFTPQSQSVGVLTSAVTVPDFTGTSSSVPGSFSLIEPANGATLPSTSPVTFRWGTSTGAVAYDVYVGLAVPPPLVGSGGSTTFSATLPPGSYSWYVEARNGCGKSRAPLNGYSTFTVSGASSLVVTVHGSDGAAKGGATVVARPVGSAPAQANRTTDSSGQAFYSALSPGWQYDFEARVTKGNPFDSVAELWSSRSWTITSGTNSLALDRNWPYIKRLTVVRTSDGQEVLPGTAVPVGTPLQLKIVAKNASAEARSVRVTPAIDQDKTQPWQPALATTAYRSIIAGGEDTFVIDFIPTVAATYFATAKLEVSSGGSDVKVDATDWTPAFTVGVQSGLAEYVWQTVRYGAKVYQIRLVSSTPMSGLNRPLSEISDGPVLRDIYVTDENGAVAQPEYALSLAVAAQSAKKLPSLNSLQWFIEPSHTAFYRSSAGLEVWTPEGTSDYWREECIIGVDLPPLLGVGLRSQRALRYRDVILDAILQTGTSDRALDNRLAIEKLESVKTALAVVGSVEVIEDVYHVSNEVANLDELSRLLANIDAGVIPEPRLLQAFERLKPGLAVLSAAELGISVSSDLLRSLMLQACADAQASERLDAMRWFVQTYGSYDPALADGFALAESDFNDLQAAYYSPNGLGQALKSTLASTGLKTAIDLGQMVAEKFASHALQRLIFPYYVSFQLYCGIRDQVEPAQNASMAATLFQHLHSSGAFTAASALVSSGDNQLSDLKLGAHLTNINSYLAWYFYDLSLRIFNNNATAIYGRVWDFFLHTGYDEFIAELESARSRNLQLVLVTSSPFFLARHADALNFSATDSEHHFLASRIRGTKPSLVISSLDAQIALQSGAVSGTVPLTVDVTSRVMGTATGLAWDFGDGTVLSGADPPAHTYSTAGTYAIRLTATGSNTTSVASPLYITANAAPVNAQFTAAPISGISPLTVAFTNTSTNAASSRWNFGDGQVSTESSPVHTYPTSGTFSVTLTAYGAGTQDSETKARYINVGGATGAIDVTTTAGAGFTISGPVTLVGVGPTAAFNAVPVGSYTIAFHDLIGYLAPPSQTITVLAGERSAVMVSYQVAAAAALRAAPNPVVFDDTFIGAQRQASITITNIGGVSASVTLSTGAPFGISGATQRTIAAGANTEVILVFSPSTAGSSSGTLSVTGGAMLDVPLSGRGSSVSNSLVVQQVSTFPVSLWNAIPSAFTYSGKIYYFGGHQPNADPYQATATIRTYDVASSAWAISSATLPYQVFDYNVSAQIMSDGKYVFGPGYATGDGGGWGSHVKVLSGSVTGGAGHESASFPFWAMWNAGSCSANGKVYFFGGHDGSNNSNIAEYDPTTETMTVVANMLTTGNGVHSILGSDGWIYYWRGWDPSVGWNKIERFNPSTRAVQARAALLPYTDNSGASHAIHVASESAIYFFRSGVDPKLYKYAYIADTLTDTGMVVPGNFTSSNATRDASDERTIYVLAFALTNSDPLKLMKVTLPSGGGGGVAPANLVATATSAAQVSLTWSGSAGASSYEVARGTVPGGFVTVATVTGVTYSDSSVQSQTSYLYKVRAIVGGQPTAYSNLDVATTIVFADDPVVAGTTLVSAVHLTQLRSAGNAVRSAAGLAPYSFAETISVGTVVRAVHLIELRTAIAAARSAAELPARPWTNTLTGGMSLVRAADVNELRTAVK